MTVNKRFIQFLAPIIALCVAAPLTLANDRNRWFEVEVILFTRDIPYDSIREEFEQEVKPITYRRTRDLLTKYHYPDIEPLFYQLGGCSIEDKIAAKKPNYPSVEALIDTYLPYLTEQERAQLTKPVISDDSEQQIYSGFDFDIQSEQSKLLEHQLEQLERQYDFYQPRIELNPPKPPLDCNGQEHVFNWLDPLYEVRLDWIRKRERNKHRSFDYHYQMYPRVIIAGERTYNNYVHSISPANFQLRQIYRTLRRQPDIRPILHTAWRQPGVAPSRSRATRLYAGIDYSLNYDFQGNPKPDPLENQAYRFNFEDQLALDYNNRTSLQQQVRAEFDAQSQRQSVVNNIEKVMAMIAQGTQVDYRDQKLLPQQQQPQISLAAKQPQQVREIDGLFRIYIDNFNYLHIDAEFNVRREIEVEPEQAKKTIAQLVQDNLAQQMTEIPNELLNQPQTEQISNKRLANYHFKQTRRVISKQLHYFDHPYMGMIVQIRRHGW